jgi:REP element-mobilizing transposase RayT
MFDRAWLLTWSCYGTRLPGDPRGFVGFYPGEDGVRRINNHPGTQPDHDVQWLRKFSERMLKEPPVCLTTEQAMAVSDQFRETARYRGWILAALAVMSDHVHLVVLVPGDPEPESLLHAFKSYGSRRLNRAFGKHEWWTASGSTRKLPDEHAIRAAVCYVRDQAQPLLVEIDQSWLLEAGEPRQGEPRQGEPRQS